MKVRLLDLNCTSYLHSQTIYHAVAYCTTKASPGTIIIVRSKDPYVSVGYHQSLEEEIDVRDCNERRIPMIRREVGGGAVFLDKDQLFFQCIFPRERAPLRVDHLYKLFLQPAVKTYRRLGVDASYVPVNDIQVNGKKICGTGAARIGDASVVVGNIMFDFNYGEMARVLRVPSHEFREKALESMELYLTTLRRELGYLPEHEDVKNILVNEFEDMLGTKLHRDELTSEEHKAVARMDKKFTSPDWLFEKGRPSDNWVKITTSVKIMESSCQSEGGTIRIILRLKDDIIDDLSISGDFLFQPRDDLKGLEDRLTGQPLREDRLLKMVESFYRARTIQSPGVGPGDMVRAIMGRK